MTISSARTVQGNLFPEIAEQRPLIAPACRNYFGEFFEEMTVSLTGGQRLKTDARKDICPDIDLGAGRYAEVKSIGCSGNIIVYKCRLEKDLAFERENNVKLYYFLWRHGARIEDGMPLSALRDLASSTLRSLTVISLATLAAALETRRMKILNTKVRLRGYGSFGYREGQTYPLSWLQRGVPVHENQHAVAFGRYASFRLLSEIPVNLLSAQCRLPELTLKTI